MTLDDGQRHLCDLLFARIATGAQIRIVEREQFTFSGDLPLHIHPVEGTHGVA